MPNAIDPIAQIDVTPQVNIRFESNDPISFVDTLTKKSYRIVSLGDETPVSPDLSADHLIKIAAKTVISLNKSHQNDFFWGELSLTARVALKNKNIFNLNNLLNNLDNLVDVPSPLLVEVMKMLVSLKQA